MDAAYAEAQPYRLTEPPDGPTLAVYLLPSQEWNLIFYNRYMVRRQTINVRRLHGVRCVPPRAGPVAAVAKTAGRPGTGGGPNSGEFGYTVPPRAGPVAAVAKTAGRICSNR